MKTQSIVLSLGLLAVVACRPVEKDPPYNAKAVRQEISVAELQFGEDSPLSKMGVANLWKKATGKRVDGTRVKIAIIGTGVDYTNPDLRNALWQNPAELGEGSENKDNDENDYVDDVFGYDFFSGDDRPYDWNGHDTYIASLIGSAGVAHPEVQGMAPNADLMILRYMGENGRGNGMDGAEAVQYALKMGAKVIYFNWPQGGFNATETTILLQTFSEAEAKNVVVVIPAGNEKNTSIPTFVRAMAKMPTTLVVSGLAADGRLSSTTNFGLTLATIAAPAEGAVGYWAGGEMSTHLKTSSVAAAYVAGAAALLSTLPQYDSAKKIKEAIVKSAQPTRVDENIEVLARGALNLSKF